MSHPDASSTNAPIDTRLKLSALWVSMLLLFVFVDLFSVYRPDIQTDIARGELAGFEIDSAFMLAITLYIVPAALMVSLALFLPQRISRIAHLGLAACYAATIIAAAVGEWPYYVMASLVEVMLLFSIARIAWRWRESNAPVPPEPD